MKIVRLGHQSTVKLGVILVAYFWLFETGSYCVAKAVLEFKVVILL